MLGWTPKESPPPTEPPKPGTEPWDDTRQDDLDYGDDDDDDSEEETEEEQDYAEKS